MVKRISLADFKQKTDELINGTLLWEIFDEIVIYADNDGNIPGEEIQRLKEIIKMSAGHARQSDQERFSRLQKYLSGTGKNAIYV